MPKEANRLRAWQLSDALVVMIYEATKTFPRTELYGLTTQMRRAAISVPANITEGAARRGQQEFLQFLYISSSSLSELGYYLHLSRQLGYLTAQHHATLFPHYKAAARTLQGLISKVEVDLNRR